MHLVNDCEKSSSDNFSDDEINPNLINTSELNDLISDLKLSKLKEKLFASRVQHWNLLDSSTKVIICGSKMSKLYFLQLNMSFLIFRTSRDLVEIK